MSFYESQQLTSSSPMEYNETKCCLICNTFYPIENSVPYEIGSFYLQNVGKILSMPVGSVEEDIKSENHPFCLDCRHKLGECFSLVQQLENIVLELDKIRDDIGKSVVQSFPETSYLRSNYVIKQKIFQQYCHKFRDELISFSVENTVTTSDFSDLLTTDTIQDFATSLQGTSGIVGPERKQKKAPGRLRNISKAKGQAKVVTENNSESICPEKKPVRSSKRKSSLKNQNVIEEVNYEFDSNFDDITGCNNDEDIADGMDGIGHININVSIIAENNGTNRPLQLKESPNGKVKKTKYQCKFCGKYCSKSNHLVIHERMHTDERPFPCSICGKAFREKGHLIRHEKTHDASRLLGEKTHLCPECGKAFVLADSLYNHRREKHMGKPQKRNIVSQMCETCGKVLHSQKSLRKHVMIIHEKQKPHSCAICEKKFSYLCNKKLHIERHHKIKCAEEACAAKDPQQIFESRELFEIHFKNDHPDKLLPPEEEPRKGPKKSQATFNCDQCHRVFKLNKWLEEHIQKVHLDTKPPKAKQVKSTGKTKNKKVQQSLKRLKLKSEIKTESESDGFESDAKNELDASCAAGLKRSPRLANKRRVPQRTVSESEADITEAEEESDEDENDTYDWTNIQNEGNLDIKKCSVVVEDTIEIEVKQEPGDLDSFVS